MNFRNNIDDKVVGVGVVSIERMMVFGPAEESEGDLRDVPKADKSLVDKVGGEGDAVELEGGLHAVKRVVVLEEEIGDEVGVLGLFKAR